MDDKIINEALIEKRYFEKVTFTGFQYLPAEMVTISAHLKSICNDENIINRELVHLIQYVNNPVLIENKKAMLHDGLREYKRLQISIQLLLGFAHSLVSSDVFEDLDDLDRNAPYPKVFDEPISKTLPLKGFEKSFECLKSARTTLIAIHEELNEAMVGIVEIGKNIEPHASKNAYKEYITNVEDIAASKWEALGGDDLRPNFPPLLSRVCQFVYDLMRPVFATSFLMHIR